MLEEWAVPVGAARGVLGVRRHVSSSKKVRERGGEERVRALCDRSPPNHPPSTQTHSHTQPITHLAWLPSAARLAATCDGGALLLDGDTLAPTPLPGGLRGVTALAAEAGQAGDDEGGGAATDGGRLAPCRLVVAARGGARGAAHAAVFDVAPGAGATAGARAAYVVEWAEPLPVVVSWWLGGGGEGAATKRGG